MFCVPDRPTKEGLNHCPQTFRGLEHRGLEQVHLFLENRDIFTKVTKHVTGFLSKYMLLTFNFED